jgi:N utilization substance protein B
MVVLYQHEITGSPTSVLFENLQEESGHEADVFTRELVEGVLSRVEEIDAVIDEHSESWPAYRLAPLERSILRIAVFEIRNDDTIPVEVSIDEAVTLAKRFCSREAARLLNGILGKMLNDASGDDDETR